MAQSALSIRYIFGYNSHVTDNGAFLEDGTFVYIGGQSAIIYSRQDKRQRFVHTPEIKDVMSAFALESQRRLAAIAEKGEKPCAHIIDLKTYRRKKTINMIDTNAKEFVSLQFSTDDQNLLTLTGGPDWIVAVWSWAKAKLLASICTSSGLMTRCSFSPIDATVICVTGKDSIKFFRMADKDLRPLQDSTFPNENMLCQCWMRHPDDHLLVGSDAGRIHLFRSGEHMYSLHCSPGPDYPIHSLITIPGGFIAGSKEGFLLFFSFDDSKDQVYYDSQFQFVKRISHDLCFGSINHMFLDMFDEQLGMTTSDNQILYMPTVAISKAAGELVEYAIGHFHGPKSITGLDVCVKKPLAITCSKDSTLKLWNFQTHRIELEKSYAEEMFSTALHPSGLHCAVGFADKLRVYHILVDDIRACLEVPIKGCRECRFSKGGNFLAAANGNSIIIYDFYTGEKIADLRGHNSKVRNIQWMDSGCHLVSCGHDGAVYLWDVNGAKRVGEFVMKGLVFSGVTFSAESIFVVGNDRKMHQLAMADFTVQKSLEAGVLLSSANLSVSKGFLATGSSEFGKPGIIRAFAYPVSGEFEDYICSSSPITRMRLTPEESFLLAVDDSGCLIVYEIRDKQDKFQRANPNLLPDLLTLDIWKDEILVTRGELEERANTIIDLKTKVDELKLHNEYQLKLKEMNYSEKIKETTDKFIQELEQAKTKYELLKEERVDSEMEFKDNITQMEEKHQFEVQETETNFQAEIMELVESYQQLIRDRDAQIERLENQRYKLVASHEKYVDDLTMDYERKLDDERQTRIQLEEERIEVGREMEEMKNQLDDDIDTEIENLRKVFEEKLATSRESTLKYKGENGIMKKKFGVISREIEEQKEEMKLLQEGELDLHEQIKMLEKEVSAHKKEIKVRDVSIGDKEKKIYELKKKNQELDKFKFVLDYKIRELKMQIEPRQLEIMAMREKIKEMDSELEKYHKTNAKLDGLIGHLRERIEGLQVETKGKRSAAKKVENNISRFRSDVQMMVIHIQDPPVLKQKAKELLEAHGSSGALKPRIDPDVEVEYGRHKDFLMKSMAQLKATLDENINENLKTNHELLQQNMELINAINNQREINRTTKMKIQAEIGRIRRNMQLMSLKKGDNEDNDKSTAAQLLADLNFNKGGDDELDPLKILERNRQRIMALRAAILELEKRGLMNKAYSREVLPPMEGIQAPAGAGLFSDDSTFAASNAIGNGSLSLDEGEGAAHGFLPPI